jgi:hypothetical protein
VCHMPRPPHSPWFDLPNNIWWWVQIMKHPIVQLSPLSHYFIPLRASDRGRPSSWGGWAGGLITPQR